ncbi:hypothetical protein B7463_g11151, partial [Scytalidium lignicola]
MHNEAAVREAILAAASENSALLVQLSSTSEAPSLLQAHNIRLSHLREAVTSQTTVIDKLKEDVDANSKRHKKFRNSITRRFFYRAINNRDKFESKASNAEQDYFSTLTARSKAEERLENLRRDYNEAVQAQKPLEAAAKEHEEAHGKIDTLYDKLFRGPTPGFVTEDQRENAYYAARKTNEQTKQRILGARRAVRVLEVAESSVNRAKIQLESARRDAHDSWLFLSDTILGLRRSDERLSHALLAVNRAKEHLKPLSPEMLSIKHTIVADLGASTSINETFFSKSGILAAIVASLERLSDTMERIKKFIEMAKEREKQGLGEIKVTARKLEDSRQELEFHRKSIFEKVAGFGEAAPAYKECCDRTNALCYVVQDTHNHEHEIDHQLEQMPTEAAPDYESLVNKYRVSREKHDDVAPEYPMGEPSAPAAVNV